MQDIVGSKKYFGGSMDWSSGHLHPLNYALGLADSASKGGVQIFENSFVDQIEYGEKNAYKNKTWLS